MYVCCLMLKFLVSSCLSICILLSSWYSHLYAHQFQQDQHAVSTISVKHRSASGLISISNYPSSFLKSTSSIYEKDHFRLNESEVEEEKDDLSPSKIFSPEAINYLAFISAKFFGHFFEHIKTNLPLRELVSYIPSLEGCYLDYQVFRI